MVDSQNNADRRKCDIGRSCKGSIGGHGKQGTPDRHRKGVKWKGIAQKDQERGKKYWEA